MKMEERKNIILEMSFDFALEIIQYCNELKATGEHIIAGQLFKSGTSIGANIREAQGAESRSDFIHKCKIAVKESEETEYWLMICNKIYTNDKCYRLLNRITDIKKLLARIIISSKSKQ